MPDYRKLYDSEYLAAWDLEGDTTVTISKVIAGEVGGNKGEEKKKIPLVYFEGAKKAMCLNKTNGKSIARMYGVKTEDWAGHKITLYPTETDVAGETVGCIRVRPGVPK